MSALEQWFVGLLVVTVGVCTFYYFALRPVIRSPTFQDRYHEQEEHFLRALNGFRTMLLAWLLGMSSVAVELYDWIMPMISGIDFTPLTSRVPGWAWPLIVLAIAALFRYLRKITHGSEEPTANITGPPPGPA